jgi:hypothetical protein
MLLLIAKSGPSTTARFSQIYRFFVLYAWRIQSALALLVLWVRPIQASLILSSAVLLHNCQHLLCAGSI